MANSSFLVNSSQSGLSFRLFCFILTCLTLTNSALILLYVFNTSSLHDHDHDSSSHKTTTKPTIKLISSSRSVKESKTSFIQHPHNFDDRQFIRISFPNVSATSSLKLLPEHGRLQEDGKTTQSQPSVRVPLPHELVSNGYFDHTNKLEVFHDKDVFLEDYSEMVKNFKIYVYPHNKDHPFARVLLPEKSEPGGNYASESYFKKALMKSHFITKDPNKAHLFFMPFSIAGLRNDRRVSVRGIPGFVRDYIFNVSRNYPHWNRTGGADHFYVACHSVGRSAMDKSGAAKFNVIQIVCSSSYFLQGYITHKDACLPQVWPRQVDPPNLATTKREKLAFFAGAMNSPVRQLVVKAWQNDTEIFVHSGRLKTPYADELLGSKFCLHAKGFEVNTARVGDSIFYGCVPVIIADYYDLPFMDVLNWNSFSVVVPASDIPSLKKILKSIPSEEYLKLQSNVLKVREHFKWHSSPTEFDAFYMVMYELWLRRSALRFSSSDSFVNDS